MARRAFGLLLAIALGWLLVDRGLGFWVRHEEAIVGQVARYVPRPDPDQMQALLSRGPAEAPMTVVLACDLALPRCRQQFAFLTVWQAQPSKALHLGEGKGEDMRRLIFLPRPSSPAGLEAAQAAHALDAQGLFWGTLALQGNDASTWSVATVDKLLSGADADAKRLTHDRDDSETVLAVQLERTMAEALEIPSDSGLLVAGLPVPATQSDGAALVARIDAAEAQLAQNIQFFGGDVTLAQARGLAELPTRTRDRFIQWILVGKKVASLPGSNDAEESDAEDEDEEEAP